MSDVNLPQIADVCIIGCGGTGSVVAAVLAKAGVKVIALDAGPVWERDDFVPDELESYAFGNHLGPKWNAEPVGWENPDTASTEVGLGLNMMNGVGGSIIHYAGHAWRFHPADFRVRSRTIEHYGEDALPQGSMVEDWPITYDDLEPFYQLVEETIGVSGQAGVLRDPSEPGGMKVIPGGNPFEGPRSTDFPMPPLRMHRVGKKVWTAAEKLGWHPFIGPTAINSTDYRGRPATNYCGFCMGYGCRIDAKGSPTASLLPEAIWTGNLEIIPEADVVRLDLDRSGTRLTSASFIKDGELHTVEAKSFFLAAYTFENVRLLLGSASTQCPGGLSNRSGMVGKGFMVHRFDSVAMLFEDEYTNRFGGPQGQRVVVDDFNSDNFDHSGLGFIAGAQIFAPNEFHPIQDLSVVPASVKSWGREYKEYIRKYWNKLALLMTNVEVLPYEDSYLALDHSRIDAKGRPMVKAHIGVHENERRLVNFMTDRMLELAEETGAHQRWPLSSMLVPSQHDAGGTRMGESSATSVVDSWCCSHEVPNLFIVGPSVFPTASGLNPSLTAQALAWRAADRSLSLL